LAIIKGIVAGAEYIDDHGVRQYSMLEDSQKWTPVAVQQTEEEYTHVWRLTQRAKVRNYTQRFILTPAEKELLSQYTTRLYQPNLASGTKYLAKTITSAALLQTDVVTQVRDGVQDMHPLVEMKVWSAPSRAAANAVPLLPLPPVPTSIMSSFASQFSGLGKKK